MTTKGKEQLDNIFRAMLRYRPELRRYLQDMAEGAQPWSETNIVHAVSTVWQSAYHLPQPDRIAWASASRDDQCDTVQRYLERTPAGAVA